MKVSVFREFGPPEVLRYEDWPDPAPPGPGEVQVRVRAVSVGRLLDIGTRAGSNRYFQGTLPHVLGGEHAGEVAEIGPGVEGLQPGDRVAIFNAVTCGTCPFCQSGQDESCPGVELIGIHRQGAYAELSLVPAANATRIPDDLSFAEAAGLALAGPVAWTQMDLAGLRAGDWVLINGAASALGSTTAVVAAHLGGRVIGTSRHARKREALVRLGLDAALDAGAAGFEDQVRELTQGQGVRIVVDDIGSAEQWPRLQAVLARHGTVVSSGAFLGETLPLDLRSLYQQSQRIMGVRTATRRGAAAFWSAVATHVRPVLDQSFPLAEAASAHRYVEAGENVGRVLLVPAAP